jgi:hypothetical protein
MRGKPACKRRCAVYPMTKIAEELKANAKVRARAIEVEEKWLLALPFAFRLSSTNRRMASER